MMRWTGRTGTGIGIAGCTAFAFRLWPLALVWAVVLTAVFAAAGWFPRHRHRAGLAVDALSASAWALAFPALLAMASALAWALDRTQGPLLAAAAWAGFAWMRLGLTLWYHVQ